MTWQQFLEALLQIVITAAIPLCLKFLYSFITAIVAEKTQNMDNKQLKEFINNAVQAVLKAVDATYQTYVDSLKKQGKFDAEAQKEAFEKAKNAAILMITEDMQKAITTMYGDFNTWLDNTIEQLVLANKSEDKQSAVFAIMV